MMTSTAVSELDTLSLIPQPVELNVTGGTLELTTDAIVVYVDADAWQPAEQLAAQLRPATGFELPVRAGTEGAIVFQTLEDPALGEEGYALRVADYAQISASTAAGLFYGAQTFRQLLPPKIYSAKKVSKPWKIPMVEIRDVPRFGWRGLMLDVARHFMPKKDVLRFIDTMASLKFNTFHWHLTDDQGWRIEIKKFPKLTEVGAWRKETVVGHLGDKPRSHDGVPHGGFYSQDDIREVVAYATERHITIIPEIDMPGHMQAALAAYPELGCTPHALSVKTEWGICKNILNPENSTVKFCKEVLTEVMELFPSEFIHIGGDEAAKDQWNASERIQQLREERGLENMDDMQSWFIRQINGFFVEKGRRLVGWDEIAEGGLADNAIVMWWRGEFEGNLGKEIANEAVRGGNDLIVASNGSLYFDESQTDDPEEPLSHNAGIITLKDVYGFDSVIDGLDDAADEHIFGVQGQLWTEYMPNMRHVEYMAFPRACALAEAAWLTREKQNYPDFLDRMKVQQHRLAAAGVNFRKS